MATRAHIQASGEESPCGQPPITEIVEHNCSRPTKPKLHLVTLKGILFIERQNES